MPSPANRPVWDVFCAVVDNYGDIGVCWRLARQLTAEYRIFVRLWVDDLTSFQPLCPQIDPVVEIQQVDGVEIRRWDEAIPEIAPGEVVVEAFGCRIPEVFIAAMARSEPGPVWVNLEYLSAEGWVEGCHTLSSPHPRLPLTKYFFFPGFSANTGGLLRERELLAHRQHFEDSPASENKFWRLTGHPPPPADVLCVSLFAYENPAIADLLSVWEKASSPVCCLVPVSRALAQVENTCARPLKAGDRVQRGALEIRVLPFVPQRDYDALLWACDLNFVRGEDSFVRAQWAAKPMVWHIYPQREDAHRVKLDAFLAIYCFNMAQAVAGAVRHFWHGWNTGSVTSLQWNDFAAHLPQLRQHAASWATSLAQQEDLSSALVRFCRSKV
ncbi:MAG: elongation factor P maturation arginine rhamnosyltransferase EarP [Betaproteobacteria bacterium]|nr:elongation factor P maturation arginine rhamnosyltransferase EarP [Betaproteobacteria bacterium]